MILANRTWGAAPDPIALLVHGGAFSSLQWTDLAPRLAALGWHVIAVDLRGHGDTPVDAATIAHPSLATEAGDLVDTVRDVRPDADSVGLLLGHSHGALVGLACAAEFPDFLQRVVLLEPGGREASDRALSAAEKRARFDDPAGFLRRMYEGNGVAAALPPDELDALIAQRVVMISAASRDYALARHEMISDVDVIGLAANCSVPTLVVLGRDKPTLLGAESGTVMGDLERYSALIGSERERFCAALPNGSVIVLEVGHMTIHRDPGYVAPVLDWLARETRRESAPASRPH